MTLDEHRRAEPLPDDSLTADSSPDESRAVEPLTAEPQSADPLSAAAGQPDVPARPACTASLLLEPVGDRGIARLLVIETLLVLGVSLGKSALYSILAIINKLTYEVPLNQQVTSMNSSTTPDRPWLDFMYQITGNLVMFVPPLLAIFLVRHLHPPTKPLAALGMQPGQRLANLARGFGLAACVGIPGLAFYLAAVRLGINTTVAAANLAETWWAIPMYCLAAFANGFLEEVVMIGYLFTRWAQAGWRRWTIILVSGFIRGSYHLYQGFGGFIGNLVMGVAMGWLFTKTRRLWPLIIAHTILDIAAFVGYALLAPVVDWL